MADADRATRSGNFQKAEALLTRLAEQLSGDFSILIRLAAVRRQCGNYTGAMDALTAALARRPRDFPALLMMGSILRAFGRREEAARAYKKACAEAPPTASLPPQLVAELDRAKETISADAAWRQQLSNVELDGGGTVSEARLKKLRDDIMKGADGPLLLEGLPETGFYDPGDFPGVAEFEAATPSILAEFQALAAQRAPELVSMDEHAGGGALAATDSEKSRKWSAIHLISDGERVEENARFAPLSLAFYERLCPPKIAGRSPNLMFSILDPHTRIPPHHGIINTRLVIHIPLVVPDNCGLRVGTETRAWVPGTALIFDDTIEHEAWNDSESLRVVLLGDLWRPELDDYERSAIGKLMARK